MPRRFAFTLIELLVVVTIIVLLLALLVPAMSSAIVTAQEAACMANLRQIGLGMINYHTEERYMIASFGGGRVLSETDPTPIADAAAIWPGQVRSYLGGNVDVFYCPAADPASRWVKALGSGNPAMWGYDADEYWVNGNRTRGTSYGHNNDGTRTHVSSLGDIELGLSNLPGYAPMSSFIRSSIVVAPADFLCIADSLLENTWDAFVDFQVRGEEMDTRHHGGARILYFDGHVGWGRSPDYLRDTLLDSQTARQWNWDHAYP
jgi:prepilin-type N-terminal cleavage/methylation domain-containing protein/prepilin-type processing-associated H-X9-DG protein